VRVSEGTRTPDRLDHNQELYQLSYAHQGIGTRSLAARRRAPEKRTFSRLDAIMRLK
jgi:hypothetical protein